METSILQIINYLFKKNKIDNTFSTNINSFFDDGVSFPLFVALSFEIESIPQIIENPKLAFHKNVNNNTALHFIYEHNHEIAAISPSYTSDQDKINLLSLILTKQYFLLNIPSIIHKYNLIIGKEEDFLAKKNDLLKSASIVKLLNVLTDGKVTLETNETDFDSIMKNSFDLAGAPLVINKSSNDFQNQFLILIQYEILFDFYKDKIDQIYEKEIEEHPEKKKEIDKLREEELKRKLEKEKHKEIQSEKQNEINKKDEQFEFELQNQKEIEKQEIERRKELEKQLEQQKKEELEQIKKQKELEQIKKQNEIEEQNKNTEPDQTIIDGNDEIMFSDFGDFNNESTIETNKSLLKEDMKSTDSDDENDKKSTDFKGENDEKSLENNNDQNSNDESNLTLDSEEISSVSLDSSFDLTPENSEEVIKKRILGLKSKFHNSDMKTFNFASSDANTKLNEVKTIDLDSDSDSSFDFESIEVRDYDSDSINEENNIQIEKTDEGNKRKNGRIKRKRKSAKLESIDDDKILKVIGSIENKTYNNIREAIENNGIPKFVMHVLHRKYIKNVFILEENKAVSKPKKKSNEKEEEFHPLSKNELKNIKAVVRYLSKKEPKFKVLLFDFSNPVYIESSAYLFYRNFINFFLLKSTKKEMFQRVVNILFSTIQKKDIKNEKRILTDWNTYVNLGFFLCNKTLHFDPNFDVEVYFEKVNIPQIVDKSFLLRLINQSEVPISIYCQLQFIFDRLDKPKNSYHVIEIFSKAMKTINMKVPRSDILASRIRAKNISLILQNKEYKSYVIQKQIYQSIVGYDPDEEEKELESNKIKMPSPPPPFNEREHNIEIIKSIQTFKKSIREVKSEDKYWDPPDFSFNIDIGILFKKSVHKKRKDQSLAKWKTEMGKIQTDVIKKSIKKKSTKIISLEKATLYKFFIYNNQKNEWEQNIEFLNLFENDKNFSNETKTPLVLFLNSNENDLRNIAVNSEIVIDEYPDIDGDDQIFVYGFGDKVLSKPKPKLGKQLETEEIEDEIINPIFLFLHIPEKLINLPKISTIVYSIYSFLCFICDIEIIILNNEYYDDQIDFIKNINVMTHSYKEDYKKEPEKIISKKSSSELHLLSDSSDDDEKEIVDDDISDDYDLNDEISNEEDTNEEDIKNSYLSFSNIRKVFTKKRKTIALFNDENKFTSSGIYQKFNESAFFNNKKFEIDQLCQSHYINLKDANSYESFIDNLNNLCLSDEVSTFSDIKKNFRFTKLTKIGSKYINLKNDKKWEEQLFKLIHNRYSLLEVDDTMNCQYITILAKIRNEILKYTPSIDIQFQNKCDEILSEIRTSKSKDYFISFSNEIENSSELNLIYLHQIINNEKFWLENEKDNLKNSHVQFLKEEFLNIIKMIYPNDVIKSVYEEYKTILYDQIQNDLNVIDKYFIKFTKKQALNQINKCAGIQKMNDIKNIKKRGTNYAVREAEHTREIKVTVQVNSDLTSEILQDF